MDHLRRVCVITGASGSLGTAFIRQYQKRYDFVAIHHRHGLQIPSQNETFVDPLNRRRSVSENQERVYAIRADLALEPEIERVCLEVLQRFHQVDFLLNAAVYGRWRPLLVADALADTEAAMRVNLLAPIRLAVGFAQHFWRARLRENLERGRNIVNVSSTAGVYVYPDCGQGIYSACKAALNFATYHMASEFWHIGVRVNAVAPNSFPSRVPTLTVLEQIASFDCSDETGRLAVLDGSEPTRA